MKRLFSAILFLAIFLAPAGCGRRVESAPDTLGLVEDLISASSSSLQKMARLAGKDSGPIVIVGDPGRSLLLSEEMMLCDYFDNVDARRVSDGLPDFSGEVIVSILDFFNAPYDSIPDTDEGRIALREIAVRNALAALDTTLRCKVLILCSPLLAENGGDDVSEFFERIGCDVPVLYSTDTSYSFTKACFTLMRDRKLFTHDIAYPAARLMMTIPDVDNSSFMAVRFSDMLVPPSFPDTVGVIAPNTYLSYVQNKH